MTTADLITVASLAAFCLTLLVVGLTLFARGLPGWRRHKPRARLARRSPVDRPVDTPVGADTIEMKVIRMPRPGNPCPDCGWTGVEHHDECYVARRARRFQEIVIPREGTPLS